MPQVSDSSNVKPMHSERKVGGKHHEIEFANQINELKVHIVNAPDVDELRDTLAVFLGNTWADSLELGFTEDKKDRVVEGLFNWELLPTAMETIGIVWTVEGLDMVDTTHLIRHRAFSFSAQVHGDRDMRHDRVMAKGSIAANQDFADRYKDICAAARNLYIDMMDSGEVHGLDARTIMPRCFEHFYIVKCNLKDLIGYVKMRVDEQIQTQVDNIVALELWLEILHRYPFLSHMIDFTQPDAFYVKQSRKGMTNIFPPNERNDVFDWHPSQFYHDKPRDDYGGSAYYIQRRDRILKEIGEIHATRCDL